LQEKRRAAYAQGGRNRRTSHRLDRLTPSTLRPVLTRLLATLEALEAGTIEPKVGSSMAAVAGAIVRCYEIAGLEAELLAAQQRLEALERGRRA
jgi:hypothetical protein